MENGRLNRKKAIFASLAIVLLAAAVGVYLFTRLHRQLMMAPSFVWRSGFTQTVNDMTLEVEVVPWEHGCKFRASITDASSGKRWQRTFRDTRPLHLCDDRKRVLITELAHGGLGIHLAYWDFRQDSIGQAMSCQSMKFLTESRLTIRPDGRFLAAIRPSPKGKGFTLQVVDLQTWQDRNVLWNRRALHAEFAGDRLLIDDSSRRYALALDTMRLSPERAGIRR